MATYVRFDDQIQGGFVFFGNQLITSGAVDTTAPVITLVGGAVSQEEGGTWTDPGYSATDNVDGNITNEVVLTGDTVVPSVPGVYTIRYNVQDAAGNSAIQRTRVVTITASANGEPVVPLPSVSLRLAVVRSISSSIINDI